MAEKRYIKGLFKDTGHMDQPEGTWRHARNMVLSQLDGTIGNEGGTEMSGHLGTDKTQSYYNPITGTQKEKVIGAIEITGDKTILFVTNVVDTFDGTGIYPRSEIGIWEKGVYTTLFNPRVDPAVAGKLTSDLKFRELHPIEGTFKIDAKGDLIVYWTDDFNPPRAFNVDRQLRDSLFVEHLYGISTTKLEHINLLNLFPYSGSVPHIWTFEDAGGNPSYKVQDIVKEGGGLRTGVYYLALAYVDDDLVATNFLTVSNPVPIVDDYDHTHPTTKKDGARAGDQTSKSLKWRVSNLNENYKYIRPIVIRKMGDAVDAYKMNDLEINVLPSVGAPYPSPPYQEVTFSGIEGFSTASVEEVIIDTIAYDTAKTIQQLDNVLYLGNTTRTTDLGYQKYANNIKSRSIVKKINRFDEVWATADGLTTGFGNSEVNEGNDVDYSRSYRYVPNILKYKGYMRDEVYAFYLTFIMNDGSMSYAYHIPGREAIASSYSGYDITATTSASEREKVPVSTSASEALFNLGRDARLFHFYDRSWVTIGANQMSPFWGSICRQMQYWENSTETYPNSDNFEIWDGISGYTGTDLKLFPVRHHKMPSNANSARTTITSDEEIKFFESVTDPTPPLPGIYNGSFRVRTSQGTGCALSSTGICCTPHIRGDTWLCDDWTTPPGFDTVFDDVPTNITAASTVYSGTTFTCPANDMNVTVQFHIQIKNDDDYHDGHTGSARLRYVPNGPAVNVNTNSQWVTGQMGIGCAAPPDPLTGVQPLWEHDNGDDIITGTWSQVMQLGETLEIQMKGHADSPHCSKRRITPLDHNENQCYGLAGVLGCRTTDSWVRFTLNSGGSEDYHDAQIRHDINILGMQFDDIKIPASYQDKIQGFRIYRAKRDYSNRTVLGQGPIIPMQSKMGTLGLCKEAIPELSQASQVMQAEGLEPETFWACSAWKEGGGNYPSISGWSDQYGSNQNAYKNLQFYDFNLLRNKYSLSPATHIQVQYKTDDLVWNGPEVNQPKKMITTLSGGGTTTPYTVKEVWGWDNNAASNSGGSFQNCYTQGVNAAMFVGGKYRRAYSIFGAFNTWGLNRVLGQKAKSYLQGDSIFKAASLGFGGKIVNLGGNSSIILGLANNLELDVLWSRPLPTDPVEQFGVWKPGAAFNLVTRDWNQVLGNYSGYPNNEPRHENYIVNLNAYKTDVYKNLDNQELVWTGYEILGDELMNFLFDDGLGYDFGLTPDFSTNNITPDGAAKPGVFGGDTFISRYGVAEAYAPSDDQTDSTPQAAIYSYIVENSDNINFRHAEDDNSLYYPGSLAKDVLTITGRASDLNHIDNIKYNYNYSADNDIRPAFPLPLRDILQSDFPTRTHRSAKHDTTSIIDNYRIFLANQFKDLPKNRGDLWRLSSFNNLLYFHMEESLFAAQGKQTMQMGDGSEAYMGSGDIFAQEPNEMIQTGGGFGGTQSQWAALTTRYGYFFVDSTSKKVFMMKDQLLEISNLGMETWFSNNLKFIMEDYGFTAGSCLLDNPIQGFGFHAIYDPKFKRIILTKREFKPTQSFIDGYNSTVMSGTGTNCQNYAQNLIRFNTTSCKFRQFAQTFCPTFPCPCGWTDIEWNNTNYFTREGWTISYYPELGVWGSFHDYIPYIYFNTSTSFYSLTDQYPRPVWTPGTPIATHEGTTFGNAGIWEHNMKNLHGILYQENLMQKYTNEQWQETINYHPFEFEFIHNEYKAENVLLSAFNYTSEVFNQENISVLEHGFTSYFIYNTLQMSEEYILEYLINTRRIGNNWKIHRFRDMAALALNNTADGYYMSTNPNIIGGTNIGTITTSSTENMFTYDGMFKTINLNYLDLTKNWNLQRKFIDKWVGIRLIYNNISNNSLNLYATDVVVRKMHR